MRNHRITTKAAYAEESRLFYAAAISCVVVFLTYMYFLSSSVAAVVMREELDEEIAEVGTQVSVLEAQYIEMQHAVSSDIASMKGYVVADEKIFIDKGEDTLVLNGN